MKLEVLLILIIINILGTFLAFLAFNSILDTKLLKLTYKEHRLHRKGIITLFKMLKLYNLKYIPIEILKKKLNPLTIYINLQQEFQNDLKSKYRIQKMEKIFLNKFKRIRNDRI